MDKGWRPARRLPEHCLNFCDYQEVDQILISLVYGGRFIKIVSEIYNARRVELSINY